jgi:hypothetical protein
MDSTIVFSLVLLAISAGLILSQRWAWQKVMTSQRSDRDFALDQVHRRTRTGALVGVLAVAMIAGDWITSPAWALAFWTMIVLLVLWVVLLAVADLRATRRHFGKLLRDHRAAEISWQIETIRRNDETRNGAGGHTGDPASGKSA